MQNQNYAGRLKKWSAPAKWEKITSLDVHTAGEPLRIITGGFPDLPGDTILQKRRWAKENFDYLRTALMWEPRGHADMYGCILTEPVSPDADFGVLFLHNEGYSSMCGHAIIALATVAAETGLIQTQAGHASLKIDTPAGLVSATANLKNGRVVGASFRNVPAFVAARDAVIDVPALGKIRYDLVFGGAFYAYVNAEDVGLKCTPGHFQALIEKGMAIKNEIMRSREIIHPFETDLGFLYGTIFVEPSEKEGVHSRNVCVFADGEVDRSPTGTGVSGRLALHYSRGEMNTNEPIVIESIIGSAFKGSVIEETTFGAYPAIIPEIGGRAFITGKNEFYMDPDDPFKDGFILR